MREMVARIKGLARSLDVRVLLVVLLIVVSTGHVGRLFADRENVRQAFVGYVLAVSVDGVLAVSLWEVANVRKRSRRTFALFVFLSACALSGGFNVWYYRLNYPADPLVLSVFLGFSAPILAAFVTVLKALSNAERTESAQSEREAKREAEHAFELEKLRIEQQERTARELAIERERTKQVRAEARAEKAAAEAVIQAKNSTSERPTNGSNGRRAPGELDALAKAILKANPDIGPRPLASELDCAPSTASGILERIRGNGHGGGA